MLLLLFRRNSMAWNIERTSITSVTATRTRNSSIMISTSTCSIPFWTNCLIPTSYMYSFPCLDYVVGTQDLPRPLCFCSAGYVLHSRPLPDKDPLPEALSEGLLCICWGPLFYSLEMPRLWPDVWRVPLYLLREYHPPTPSHLCPPVRWLDDCLSRILLPSLTSF